MIVSQCIKNVFQSRALMIEIIINEFAFSGFSLFYEGYIFGPSSYLQFYFRQEDCMTVVSNKAQNGDITSN